MTTHRLQHTTKQFNCTRSVPNCHVTQKVTTTTTIFTALVSGITPGEQVPEENFWHLWCKERLTEADTLTVWLGATPTGLTSAHLHHPPIFYRADALPATQLEMLKKHVFCL